MTNPIIFMTNPVITRTNPFRTDLVKSMINPAVLRTNSVNQSVSQSRDITETVKRRSRDSPETVQRHQSSTISHLIDCPRESYKND